METEPADEDDRPIGEESEDCEAGKYEEISKGESGGFWSRAHPIGEAATKPSLDERSVT